MYKIATMMTNGGSLNELNLTSPPVQNLHWIRRLNSSLWFYDNAEREEGVGWEGVALSFLPVQ